MEYRLKDIRSFEPIHIFECGQCFRWNREEDGSYTGVFGGNVLNVKKEKDEVIFKGIVSGDIKEVIEDYFDLKRDYEKIKEKLSLVDNNLKTSIEYGYGIRILNQDIWETIISFIISANNNIPRIKGIIERISKKYGKEIVWDNKTYYTFPTPRDLSRASVKDLKELGLGFRDKRVYKMTKMILNKEVDLEKLKQIKEVELLREKLLLLPGVGPKVADCIMLFSLKKYEVFPIDVWIERTMNELYNVGTKKQIQNLAHEKYGNLAGLAQQYLFYWKRQAS